MAGVSNHQFVANGGLSCSQKCLIWSFVMCLYTIPPGYLGIFGFEDSIRLASNICSTSAHLRWHLSTTALRFKVYFKFLMEHGNHCIIGHIVCLWGSSNLNYDSFSFGGNFGIGLFVSKKALESAMLVNGRVIIVINIWGLALGLLGVYMQYSSVGLAMGFNFGQLRAMVALALFNYG